MRYARLAWPLAVVAYGLLATTFVVSILNGSFERDPGFLVPALLIVAGYSSIGALLTTRNPANPVSWLLLAVGLIFVISGLASEYADYAYVTRPGDLPFGAFAAWTTNWSFNALGWAVLMILLLFPTGRLLSPRWRPVAWGIGGTTIAASLLSVLRPATIELSETSVPNPTGVEALGSAIDVALPATSIVYLVLIVASVGSLALRFRRADGEERQQIRWLAYVSIAALASVGLLLVTAIFDSDFSGPISGVIGSATFFMLFGLIGFGVPAACAVAVLRYRLWDLDIVVKKTVLYAVLTVLLLGVAAAAALAFGGIVVGIGVDRDQPLLLLLTGAAIGLGFVPLRRLASRVADRVVYGGRATPYEVLTEFSTRVAGSYASDDVLPRMAQLLGAAVSASEARVWILVGHELRPAAAWPQEADPGASRASEPDRLPPLPGMHAFEVRHLGELLGALTVRMPPSDTLDPARERVVRDLAGQAGLVLRNVRLIEELRASRQRLVAAQDEERRKLERNIHDGAQQQLVALTVKARLARALTERDPAQAAEMLAQIEAETQRALEDLRNLARGIYPPLLADQGLGPALEAQARRSSVPIAIDTDGVRRYPQDVESAVYFSCLEALNNVAKYADASAVTISLVHDDGMLRFTVTDDGQGFDPRATTYGTGVQGIADRLDAIGGAVTITSEPGRGTTLRGTVPVV